MKVKLYGPWDADVAFERESDQCVSITIEAGSVKMAAHMTMDSAKLLSEKLAECLREEQP